ncbi:MAG: 5'-nucleotidase/UDP-sugar diphosphatase, partial [Candidatus Latescibacterota bacterium]
PSAFMGESSRGGFARLVSVLGRADKDALILDAGDALGEAALARFGRGALVAQLMQEAGYAAMVPGNHEFDYGIDTLRVRVKDLGFPLLAANVEVVGESPLQKWMLVERAGLHMGLTGLLSPSVQRVINPLLNPGLKIGDPYQALSDMLPELAASTDYIIVLVHMEEEEALQLAQRFPEVDLFIAGGFRRGVGEGSTPHQILLSNGTRILSTPGRGAFVGRVDLELARTDSGMVELDFAGRLLPLDETVPPDPKAAALIQRQVEYFVQAGSEVIGLKPDGAERLPQWAAQIIRQTLAVEVGFLNQGTLHPIALQDTVRLEHIRKFVRYDDLLVALDLTGKELARLASESKGRKKAGQKLLFSGYEAESGKVNGRKLDSGEVYRVATTAYLAEGGDDYFSPRQLDYNRESAPSLQQSIIDVIRIGKKTAVQRGSRVWKMRTQLDGSLSWAGFSEQAAAYRDVSFLSGKEALSWSAQIHMRLNYEMPTGKIENQLRSNYGQVRTEGRFREAADRLQADVTYTRETRKPAPFVALALNTVWTKEKERPLSLRGSAGFHKLFGANAKVRLGLGIERDFITEQSDLGIEALPEYKLKWGENTLATSMKLFVGASQTRTISIQQYNALSFHLSGDLHFTINANFFAHRSSAVGDTGFKSELQVGLGHVWKDKWF